MKKLFIVSLAVAFALVSVAPALATEEANGSTTSSAVQEKVKAAKAKLAKKFVPRAVTFSGELTKLSGTTLPAEMTVKVSGVSPKKLKNWKGTHPEMSKEFTFKVTDKTVLVRAYGAKSSLADVSLGDKLKIVVKYAEDGTWTAKLVKDNSLHVFLRHKAVVESIDVANNTFVVKQGERTLTVKVSDKTKFAMKGSTTTTFADLKVGDKVGLRGIVNTNLKTVNASSVVIQKRAEVVPAVPATNS